MNLAVYVAGREVAELAGLGDFQSQLTYREGVALDDFVSLTMPVRPEPWLWDDTLHPIFQMNLPEGFLLQVLQEEFGPVVGASPTALLSVVGRNMIGRLQVAPTGADLAEPPQPVDVEALLAGDNSEIAFAELVRKHARSGVSGVVPKFLDSAEAPASLGRNRKATLLTHRHLIKGSSRQLPFVALNEHLCMQVARQVMPAAKTQVSADGQALLVERFDLDAAGLPHWGLEDFCALVGMRPANKYETTWERIARAVRDHVPVGNRPLVFREMTTLLLLTYALRNADCHAKNLALRYTSRADVHLAPAYDMVTTAAYADYADNPPGISFLGKKTWAPGRNLHRFITSQFGVEKREQDAIIDGIAAAMRVTGPAVREAMERLPAFRDQGKRMLACWDEGLNGLCDKRMYSLGPADLGPAFVGFSDPQPVKAQHNVVGASELLARRVKKKR